MAAPELSKSVVPVLLQSGLAAQQLRMRGYALYRGQHTPCRQRCDFSNMLGGVSSEDGLAGGYRHMSQLEMASTFSKRLWTAK
jgi:hypothetical protein